MKLKSPLWNRLQELAWWLGDTDPMIKRPLYALQAKEKVIRQRHRGWAWLDKGLWMNRPLFRLPDLTVQP